MKKIGLVGGIGPASTVKYYLGIIEKFSKKHGTYPEIVIDSVNMLKHDMALEKEEYEKLCGYLLSSISNLESAGAEVAAITANTEHVVWDKISEQFSIPVISIIDATVSEIKRNKYKNVLVFGTETTMRSGMYEKALMQNDIKTVIPSDIDISIIGNLIYPNLENGIVIPDDRRKLIKLAEKYIEKDNVDAMILGCTELSLAIHQDDICVDVLDTTEIHINEIVRQVSCL